MASYSIVARGVRSSSEFSDMVWSMSSWLPKLENVSSVGLRIGLRCRREGAPKGLDGRGESVLGTGEECARIICGAEREEEEDRERAWPLAKGERVRGRRGRFGGRLAKGDGVRGEAGSVAGRCVFGSEVVRFVGRGGRALRGASSTSRLGGGSIIGGSETRGTMVFILCWRRRLTW